MLEFANLLREILDGGEAPVKITVEIGGTLIEVAGKVTVK
jgi:hypothetical protein